MTLLFLYNILLYLLLPAASQNMIRLLSWERGSSGCMMWEATAEQQPHNWHARYMAQAEAAFVWRGGRQYKNYREPNIRISLCVPIFFSR